MQTTIRGIYDNGKIILYEKPLIDTPTEVLVTITTLSPTVLEDTLPKGRKGGWAKDYILYVAPDFDEPIDDHFDAFSE